MHTASARLTTLKARDVMSRHPVTLTAKASLASARSVLERHKITGAPVVDEGGALVGILSLWDLVRGEKTPTPDACARTCHERENVVAGAASGESSVRDRMSPCVGTVSADRSIVDVARIMCERHWHRLPVVGHDGRLVGIISTMDLLAAFVNAFDESA